MDVPDSLEETMFGKHETRTQKAERIAGQAWENLVSSVDGGSAAARSAAKSAAKTASKRTSTVVDDASGRVTTASKEARRRASHAFDALAGRKPARPWGLLAAAGAAGLAVGWVATVFGRQLAARADEKALERSISEATLAERPAAVVSPTTTP